MIGNEKDDLVVMNNDAYEKILERLDLYSKISDGLDDISAGNTRPFSAAMTGIHHTNHC